MTFSAISGIHVNDPEHVPYHIRIDRLTTDAVVRRSHIHGRSKAIVLYQVWEGDTCTMIGSADDVGAELGLQRSSVTDYAAKNKVFDKEIRIRKVE